VVKNQPIVDVHHPHSALDKPGHLRKRVKVTSSNDQALNDTNDRPSKIKRGSTNQLTLCVPSWVEGDTRGAIFGKLVYLQRISKHLIVIVRLIVNISYFSFLEHLTDNGGCKLDHIKCQTDCDVHPHLVDSGDGELKLTIVQPPNIACKKSCLNTAKRMVLDIIMEFINDTNTY
jgi:hypothetical protein